MKIGVTGGAGYIAVHVILDLLQEGHEVTVLDNLSTGNPVNILPESSQYHFIEGDTSRPDSLERFFKAEPEVIFHFAASKAAGESMTDPIKYSANNIRGTLTLVEMMIRRGCRYLIFSSSAAVYGEPQYTPIDEKHPLVPINYYGFTKYAIEQDLQWMSRLTDFRFAALRYFNAAGYDIQGRVKGAETQTLNLLPIVMETASGKRGVLEIYGNDYDTRDGTCIRDYIHINDLARAHVLSMHYLVKTGKDITVNLGSEKGLTVLEMLESARRITGKEIPSKISPRRAGDPPALIASSKLARELLGWEAKYSTADLLVESTWRLYK